MKTLFLFLINLLLTSAYSQTTTIEYKLERNISEKKLKKLPKFAKKAFSKDYFYTLTYCNNIVEYKINETIKDNETYLDYEKNEVIRIDNSMQKYIYKDLQNNITYSKLNSFNETLNIKDSLINRKWKITSETKIINGYICFKAISKVFKGKTYAWFTEKNNIKTGPDLFDGLPGLILEINTEHFNWIATSIKTELKDSIIKKPEFIGKTYTFKEGEKITKEKLQNR
ncbi:GLPGLI family protein [uncultured Flavobacterium sp.]|uniref:GLPGLI family protein n=1 Tax=uncultured Flavobacterium sp. TaxID=165435 RepID=UPI0030EBCF9C|tara:strand:+ start:146682 stop:147362 length:681 start_codon:yes stop_codon:yes gene_type:complete